MTRTRPAAPPRSPCKSRTLRMTDSPSSKRQAARQTQFLSVVSRDEATAALSRASPNAAGSGRIVGRRFVSRAARVLARDVVSEIDVPGFDRSNVDGFAVRSADTAGAMEEQPRAARSQRGNPRTGSEAATGRPTGDGYDDRHRRDVAARCADCVVMVEHTGRRPRAAIRRRLTSPAPRSPGRLWRSPARTWPAERQSSRPGNSSRLAKSACSRRSAETASTSSADRKSPSFPPATRSSRRGGLFRSDRSTIPTPTSWPRRLRNSAANRSSAAQIPDNEAQLQRALGEAMECDMVLLSGGTVEGRGRSVVSGRQPPRRPRRRRSRRGAQAGQTDLPGGQQRQAGRRPSRLPNFRRSSPSTNSSLPCCGRWPVCRRKLGSSVSAVLPHRVNSDRGRTEYLLVSLVRGASGLTTYPLGKGSGSVTTFSLADGFLTIDQHTEIVEAESEVCVTLLDQALDPADLVVIGSHCTGTRSCARRTSPPWSHGEDDARRQHRRPAGCAKGRMRRRRRPSAGPPKPTSTIVRSRPTIWNS